MAHRHWGCTAILQIVILVMGLATLILAITCIQHDRDWNIQLYREGRVFSPQERALLQRDNYFLEVLFILIVTSATILGAVNLGLCFLIKSEHYKNYLHNKIIIILAIVYFVASPFIIISALVYDSRYRQVEATDNRTYTLRFQVHDREVRQPSRSHFYYCHLGHGKPRKASELKGLRIRTAGSKLCQLIGLKIVAGILSVYMGIICLLTKWQADSHERYLNSIAAKQLFELYGDSKEYEFEHVDRINSHLSTMTRNPPDQEKEKEKGRSKSRGWKALLDKRDRRVTPDLKDPDDEENQRS